MPTGAEKKEPKRMDDPDTSPLYTFDAPNDEESAHREPCNHRVQRLHKLIGAKSEKERCHAAHSRNRVHDRRALRLLEAEENPDEQGEEEESLSDPGLHFVREDVQSDERNCHRPKESSRNADALCHLHIMTAPPDEEIDQETEEDVRNKVEEKKHGGHILHLLVMHVK